MTIHLTKKGSISHGTSSGQFIKTVEKLGYVPPCVRDAFSWLQHPFGRVGRGTKAQIIWFWQYYEGTEFGRPPEILKPDSARCGECVFQEPPWSQGYAGCSHSWLHNHDGDCQAFFSRAEFLKLRPDYAEFCVKPPLICDDTDVAHLGSLAYWADGTCYDDLPHATLNIPSSYYASLNMEWLHESGLYSAIEAERLRRFWQWTEEEAKKVGMYQYNMFLTALSK